MILVSQTPLARKTDLAPHQWKRWIGGKSELCLRSNPLGIFYRNEPFASQDMVDAFVKVSNMKHRPKAIVMHPETWKSFTSGF